MHNIRAPIVLDVFFDRLNMVNIDVLTYCRRTFVFLFVMALIYFVAPVLAFARTGDMFENYGLGPTTRPWVPSDQVVGPDMFPRVPLMYDRNADMFSRIRMPYDFGRADMFATHASSRPVPPYSLFDYPKK